MNLEALKSFILKSHKLLLLLGVLFVLFYVIWFFIDNPNGDQGFGKIPKPKLISRIDSKVVLSGRLERRIDLPRLINVYSKPAVMAESDLVTRLNFSSSPKKIGDSTLWEQRPRSLKINSKQQNFVYLDDKPVGGKTTTKEQAAELSTKFFREIGLVRGDTELTVENTGFVNVQTPEFEIVDEKKTFNVYSFNLGAKVGGVSLVNETGSKVLFDIWVGVDGNIRKANGNLQYLEFIEKSTYPVKKTSQIKSDLKKGNFKVVNMSTTLFNTAEMSIGFLKGEIAYLLTSDNAEFLQPVIILQGIADDSAGTNLVTAMLEGLKTSSYK